MIKVKNKSIHLWNCWKHFLTKFHKVLNHQLGVSKGQASKKKTVTKQVQKRVNSQKRRKKYHLKPQEDTSMCWNILQTKYKHFFNFKIRLKCRDRALTSWDCNHLKFKDIIEKKQYFNQQIQCTAPICRSKYTTNKIILRYFSKLFSKTSSKNLREFPAFATTQKVTFLWSAPKKWTVCG